MSAVRSAASRARLDPDELAALEEQRDFLLASLDDLDREHAAGDLDDHDHRVLHDDYTARAAEVLRAIDERRVAMADLRRPTSTGRVLTVVAGVALFSIVTGLLVANALGRRDADESATGGIRSTPSQEARRCVGRIRPGSDPRPALECFQRVLETDPRNPIALAYQGWTLNLTAMAGGLPAENAQQFRATAERFVDRSLSAEPGFPDALAFAAVIAFQGGRPADARGYLERLDRSNPPPEITSVIDQFELRRRIDEALAGPPPGGGPAATAPAVPSTPVTPLTPTVPAAPSAP